MVAKGRQKREGKVKNERRGAEIKSQPQLVPSTQWSSSILEALEATEERDFESLDLGFRNPKRTPFQS